MYYLRVKKHTIMSDEVKALLCEADIGFETVITVNTIIVSYKEFGAEISTILLYEAALTLLQVISIPNTTVQTIIVPNADIHVYDASLMDTTIQTTFVYEALLFLLQVVSIPVTVVQTEVVPAVTFTVGDGVFWKDQTIQALFITQGNLFLLDTISLTASNTKTNINIAATTALGSGLLIHSVSEVLFNTQGSLFLLDTISLTAGTVHSEITPLVTFTIGDGLLTDSTIPFSINTQGILFLLDTTSSTAADVGTSFVIVPTVLLGDGLIVNTNIQIGASTQGSLVLLDTINTATVTISAGYTQQTLVRLGVGSLVYSTIPITFNPQLKLNLAQVIIMGVLGYGATWINLALNVATTTTARPALLMSSNLSFGAEISAFLDIPEVVVFLEAHKEFFVNFVSELTLGDAIDIPMSISFASEVSCDLSLATEILHTAQIDGVLSVQGTITEYDIILIPATVVAQNINIAAQLQLTIISDLAMYDPATLASLDNSVLEDMDYT